MKRSGEVYHLFITVDTDDKEYKAGGKTLADVGCERLNAMLKGKTARVINIEARYWTREIHQREDSSITWYDRKYCELSVFLERPPKGSADE